MPFSYPWVLSFEVSLPTRIALILIFLLAASLTMAGSSKSENLRDDQKDWDRQWSFSYDGGGKFQLEVNMLVHHSIANAASKNGKFTIGVNIPGVNVDNRH